MKFRKVLCGVTAALTVLSSTAVIAQAEQAQELKLLTEPISSANNAHSVWSYGDGYFAPGTEEDDNSKFFHIGEKELAEWRETGKFTYTNIESDFDTNGLSWMYGGFSNNGEYIQFAKVDADGNASDRTVLHLDKENNKLTTVYTQQSGWLGTRSDGYSLHFMSYGKTLGIGVLDSSGETEKSSTAILTSNVEDFWWSGNVCASGDNVGYVALVADQKAGIEGNDLFSIELYAVKKNCNLELIYKNEETYGFTYLMTDNGIMFADLAFATAYQYKFYSAETDKTYDIGYAFISSDFSREFYPSNIIRKTFGTKVIVEGKERDDKDGTLLEGYVLVDVSKEDSGNLITQPYKSMSTNDGKIYLAETFEGKWGFIDENGKELAFFDDASEFAGDYAPVVKDGKAYLIDRNMNKVSEEIDGTACSTCADGLYTVKTESGLVFVTYAKPDDTTSDPVTSEPTSSEPTSSEPTSSEPTSSEPTSSEPTSSEPASSEPASSEPVSSNAGSDPADDNPGTGFAIALVPIALASGAAAAVTRRKRK